MLGIIFMLSIFLPFTFNLGLTLFNKFCQIYCINSAYTVYFALSVSETAFYIK